MPKPTQNGDADYFLKAVQDWDLERLLKDIGDKQHKKLPSAKQRNLRAILLGLSPLEASKQLLVSEATLKPAFSELYRFIEDLTDQPATSVTYKNASLVLASYRKGAISTTKFDLLGRDRDYIALANLSKTQKIILIKAGAGVGKSTLAREFLQTQFKKVIRLEMGLESGNVTPAEEKVSQILRKDFDEEPSLDFGINLDTLRTKLLDRENPIGVLIDNLEPALDESFRFQEKLRSYENLLGVLCDRDVCSFALITSRRSLIAQRVTLQEYLLKGLDISSWRQYFHDCENVETSEALIQMRDDYNGNAKVMGILHGAITNRFDGNIEAYWSRYKDALLADSELETLISVEMDWLRDHQSDAYKLLCRMGCYRYQDVKTIPFEGLICLLWDAPESRRTWVVDYLSKSSLIEVKGEYSLHSAIREAAKSRLLENNLGWEKSNQQAAQFWTDSVKTIDTIDDGLRAFEAYHHAIEIFDIALAAQVIVKKRNSRWWQNTPLGKSLYRLGLLNLGIRSIDSIVKKLTEPHLICLLLNILGDFYWLIGESREALECYEISKELAIQHERLLQKKQACFGMALCYFDLWEIDLCISLCQETLSIKTEDIEDEDDLIGTHTCCSLLLSWIYSSHEIAKINDADILVQETLNIFPVDYFLEWGRCYSLFFLGGYWLNKEDFISAFRIYKQMLAVAKESNYKQAQAKALIGIGITSRNQNQPHESLLNLLQSIDLLKEINARPDLADAYFQISLTYQVLGSYKQVEAYKAKALEIFKQMEAPKQIERVNKALNTF